MINIFDLFQKKDYTVIGTFEVSHDLLIQKLLSLAGYVGLKNPATVVSSAKKGISIIKKGDKYKIILKSFTPPLSLVWYKPIDTSEFYDFINHAIEKELSIGYINVQHKGIEGIKYQFSTCQIA